MGAWHHPLPLAVLKHNFLALAVVSLSPQIMPFNWSFPLEHVLIQTMPCLTKICNSNGVQGVMASWDITFTVRLASEVSLRGGVKPIVCRLAFPTEEMGRFRIFTHHQYRDRPNFFVQGLECLLILCCLFFTPGTGRQCSHWLAAWGFAFITAFQGRGNIQAGS